ncbi:MAG: hypothetical protein QOJ07_2270 [Thermoleophilaceae bacterium]|nr:hypothetical protein [Thermoleophilaceae bacterium]
MGTLRRTAAIAALALVAALVGATSASASSLVFIKDGNVWLAQPDGSRQYQVTSDGSASDPYYSPSEADDGTIVAARGTGRPASLYRMTQNGTQLNTPFQPTSPLGNVLDPRVSPDGSTVAYWFVTSTNGCTISNGYCPSSDFATDYSYADHAGTPADDGLQVSVQEPSWTSNSQVLLSTDSQNEWYDNVGGGDNSYVSWWTDCDVFPGDCGGGSFHYPHQITASRSGGVMALVRNTGDRPAADSVLDLLAANGGPPAKPIAKCELTGPSTGALGTGYFNPTLAPDGSAAAWAEGDGIHTARIGSLDDCTQVTGFENVVIPGGSEPFLSPADENPAARPGSGSTGTDPGTGTTGTQPGGGSTSSPAPTRCVVPNVRKKSLTSAKKLLVSHHCKLGKVTKPKHVAHGRKLVVGSEKPGAGKHLAVGSKVALKLVAVRR